MLLELYIRLADRHRFVLFAFGEQLLVRCTQIITEHEQLVTHLREGNVTEFATVLRHHIAEAIAGSSYEFAPGGVNPALLTR